MKNYLITGGAGFIGSNFIHYMLDKYSDINIICLDSLTYAGNLENLKDIENNCRFNFLQYSITDRENIIKTLADYNIDCVINFAAETHVDRSIADPDIFIKTNILGTSTLLNAVKKEWSTLSGFRVGKKFLQVSTDEVYGSLGTAGYFTESTPLDPHSPYSASKASADMIVKAYYDTYGMPINITRCSNNYGPYQFPEKLIPLVINNCLNKKLIPVYGDGLNVRDWLYVVDHCRAIDIVLQNGKAGEIYNIGGNNERTNIHIVRTIINYIHENVDSSVDDNLIRYIEDRKGHDRRYAIDSSKIKNDLSWKPKTAFEDGIKKTIQWYLDNKEWMDNVTSGEYQKYYDKMYSDK